MTRALFVNSGILGHRSVAHLLRDAAGAIPGLSSVHIDLSTEMTTAERAVRRLFSVRIAPLTGAGANLDFRRWRQEMYAGLQAASRISAAERGGAFDVLHFHTQATAYASLRRMRRTPAIVSVDSTQHLARLEHTSAASRWSYAPNVTHDGRAFAAAAAITATSDWAARDLAAHYPASAAKVRVMPYPVTASFEPAWLDERRERARAGARVRVMFMGGDFLRKGGADLLAAWQAGQFADRAELVVVTDWPLAAAAIPPGVQVVRSIRAQTAEWTDLWRRADLFVLPTRHEAFGMVFQEAAAAGVPAVGTRLNAVPEIVKDGDTGILVPPGDVAALVRAIGALIDTPALRLHMGRAARERMQLLWDPARYATALARIIRQIHHHGTLESERLSA